MRPALNISDTDDPKGRELGAIIIELALVMPFLVLLFITIVDLGLLLREHQIVQNAAREGARFSSLPQNCILCRPADCQGQPPGCKTQLEIRTAIEARVISYMAQEGMTITASNITINQCFQMPVTIGADTVTVVASTVTIIYDSALLVPVPSLGGATLRGSAVFRNLYDPRCP